MKFKIEQVAICPPDPKAARRLLTEMAGAEWVEDQVTATGEVFGVPAANRADLAFDYTLLSEANEFEVLHYHNDGHNWMSGRCRVSHLGMHCTESELAHWREFFTARGIEVAQEVITVAHTNAAIKDKRRYNYVIFDTFMILGVDIKFIVRKDL